MDVAPDATATLPAHQADDGSRITAAPISSHTSVPMTLRCCAISASARTALRNARAGQPNFELPDELDSVTTRFSLSLPDAQAPRAIVREEAFSYSRDKRRQARTKSMRRRARGPCAPARN
jgi:hypothetical protein